MEPEDRQSQILKAQSLLQALGKGLADRQAIARGVRWQGAGEIWPGLGGHAKVQTLGTGGDA